MIDSETSFSSAARQKVRLLVHRLRSLRSRIINATDSREIIHFLHIGKNAGTQFSNISAQINKSNKKYRIVHHPHHIKLGDIPRNEKFVFSIRLPDTRFKSAFYSRKRKGQPRFYSEWSEYEAKAFEEFEHANDLAEALFEQSERSENALCAMKSISHCSSDQINWFHRCGYFFEINQPVHIIRQEHFEEDLAVFNDKIGHVSPTSVENDPIVSHKNDYSDIPVLSEKAINNLKKWYVQDYEFYAKCVRWINKNN